MHGVTQFGKRMKPHSLLRFETDFHRNFSKSRTNFFRIEVKSKTPVFKNSRKSNNVRTTYFSFFSCVGGVGIEYGDRKIFGQKICIRKIAELLIFL